MKIKIIIIVLFTILLSGCQKEPIKIGFIATMTGSNAEIGIHARNTMILALDEANKSGGINGRKLEMVEKEINLDSVKTEEAIRDFEAQGISVVVGPYLSSALSFDFSKYDVLIFSPTVSTSRISGKDDNFVRVIQANSAQGLLLAGYTNDMNLENILIIYDKDNAEYALSLTESYKENIKQKFLNEYTYSSKTENITTKLEAIKDLDTYDGALVVSNSFDLALTAQYLKNNGFTGQIMTGQWGYGNDLLKYGGKNAEGVIVVGTYQELEEHPFYKAYLERFKIEPLYTSFYTFDAINILVKVLKEGTQYTAQAIKSNMINRTFDGIMYEIEMDAFGDSQTGYNLFVVKNGEYELMDR